MPLAMAAILRTIDMLQVYDECLEVIPMPQVLTILRFAFVFCASAALAGAQLPDQTGADTTMRHGPPPPDTRLTKMEGENHVAGMTASSLKITFGRKSQEWTAEKIATLPHETMQVMDARNQAQQTYSGVPLIALLMEVGVPQRLKGKDLRLYVVAEGRDGNKVVYSLGEVSPDEHEGEVLLVDSVDGRPLGGNGPIVLISSGERRDSRWVRGVVSIKVKSAD